MRISVCVGDYAGSPYYIAGLEMPVYSMEELCFGLRENAFLLDMSIMCDDLVNWIDKECGQKDLASELYNMVHRQGSLSSFVTMILRYVGLFEESVILEVERVLKQGSGLSDIEKRKSQIDFLVKKKKYAAAIRGYDSLLAKWDVLEQEGKELPAGKVRAAILHNKAVALAGMMLYNNSAEYFKAAYEADGDVSHYKAFLAAKRMCLSEGAYIAFAAEQVNGYEHTLELEKKLESLKQDWVIQPEHQRILQQIEWRNEGNRQRYLDENEIMTQALKRSYCNSAGE